MTPRLVHGIVYGPVRSRRFGMSLGVNLSGGAKRCTFDCRYCFRGPAPRFESDDAVRAHESGPPMAMLERQNGATGLPTAEAVTHAVETWIATSCLAASIDDITVAGNGEPTIHPALHEILLRLLSIRDRRVPNVKVTILTNGMGLVPRIRSDHVTVRRALGLVDRPCLKIDAGTERTFHRLSRPAARVMLAEWLEAAVSTQPMMLQTMLVAGTVDNTTPEELAAMVDAYRVLGPSSIDLLTINKATATGDLVPVSTQRMADIREYFRSSLAATGHSPRLRAL